MKMTLEKNACDVSLPVQLRNAASAGLTKLMKYYSFAVNNHFNMIATSAYNFPDALFKSVLIIPCPVCHLGLKLRWFNKLGSFAYDRAKTVIEHVLEQYKDSAPTPAPTRSPSPVPEDEIEF
jgi:hypothetical protein